VNMGSTPLLRFNSLGASSASTVAGILRVAFPDARTVLDLTPGAGCFWSELEPIHVTVEASQADFRDLPYADGSYDVPVLDPPHISGGGQRSVMAKRYGTMRDQDFESDIRAGLREAWRVARVGTIVKVTDHVHCSRFMRMSGWAFDELGEPFDVVHQLHTPLIDPKWREPQLSARNNGSTYLIFRKGNQRHVRPIAITTERKRSSAVGEQRRASARSSNPSAQAERLRQPARRARVGAEAGSSVIVSAGSAEGRINIRTGSVNR
jgi:hypothetical protein